MKKAVTIHDIARKANTSSATVSRVLSNTDYPVRPELQEKVRRIAEEMNYVPNMLGRQLKTNKGNTIGVIIPSISNPFYSATVLGIEETARQRGYHVLLCNSHRSPELESEYVQTLLEKQVRGVIISSISSDQHKIQNALNQGMHIVAFDQSLRSSNGYQIHFDYRKGGYIATKHLIDCGHQSIAFITAPLERPSRNAVFEGYLDALREANIAENPDWIKIAESEEENFGEQYEFNNGRLLTQSLLDQTDMPSAIFAINDMTAFGVMHELNQQDIRVPNDISVIGFDNIEFSHMVHPTLTTIQQPKYEMGRLACTALLDQLNGETTEEMEVLLQPKLIERGSVLNK